MLIRLLRHVRDNTIAYMALFFSLSGTATAAGIVLMKGDPAGGDLTGTYPNPVIAQGAIDSGKLARFQGFITFDVQPIAPSTCSGGFGRVISGLEPSDIAIVRPIEPFPFRWPVGLILREGIEESGGLQAVVAYVCNITNEEIDPPPTTFRFIVIH